jgi:hypothetical protein
MSTRLDDEVERLRTINDELTAFDETVRQDVFKRLVAASQSRVWGVLGAVGAGLLVALLVLAWRWHDQWQGFWKWLQVSTIHWALLALALGLIIFLAVLAVASGLSAVGRIPGKAVAIVAGGSGVVALLFALYPNLVPSTEKSFTFRQIALERHVSLKGYLNRPYVKAVTNYYNDWKFRPRDHDGTVVDFQHEEKGLQGKEIGLRWLLFDAATDEPVGRSDHLDPLCTDTIGEPPSPCLFYVGHKKDLDVGSFGFWIDTSGITDRAGKPVKCFYVRLEAYVESSRLTYANSSPFPPPSKSSRACVQPHSQHLARG